MSVTISSDSTLVGDTTSSSGDIVDLSASPASSTDMMSHFSRHRCFLGHDHQNSRTVGSRLRRDNLRRLPRGGNEAPPLIQYIPSPNLPEVVRFVDETIDFQSTSDWNEIASRVRGARNIKTRRKTIPRRASLRALKSPTFHRFR